ncbi:TauD/TfdA family dioxygenase [Streptomyces pathocidini]|uniref:TauD/TfdA family dioxygenase n=1 Tax=Streptomyces pathocidini TaxID=1650571 RepID=A0ABW7UUF8_9ACTN|nr:TauD/TfdA family dioxygenase [Streptomyces pathocidini]
MSVLPPTVPIRVPDGARDAAAAALMAVADLGSAVPDADVRHYLSHGARQLRAHLPGELLQALAAWQHSGIPWLTLSNLPRSVHRVPTPRAGFCDEYTEERLKVPNLVQFGLLRLLGLDPVAYAWENEGRLIRNVAPSAGAARTRTSWGHACQLAWHTDDSVLEHGACAAPSAAIPHFLSFYGIRNAEGVPTELLPVDTVLAELPERVAGELRRPQFAVKAPESYAPARGAHNLHLAHTSSYGTHTGAHLGPYDPPGTATGGHIPHSARSAPYVSNAPYAANAPYPGGEPPVRTDVPLLWTLRDGSSALRYGPGRVTGQTAWARAALRWFEDCLAGLEGVSVLVGAGAFHLFDNRRVLHRRASFEPAPPGEARWLRRCYAMRSRLRLAAPPP